METNSLRPMTPFDNLVNPHSLYMLKLFLSYTPPGMQRTLGIYIKFLELKNTLDHFRGFRESSSASFTSLKDYMMPEEKEMMEQIEMVMNMMEMMQGMPDTENLGGMPGMQDMAEMFSQMSGMGDIFSQMSDSTDAGTAPDAQKGEDMDE